MGDERHTILLVEDDPQLRVLFKRMLSRDGYEVLDAPTASDAIDLATRGERSIDLLITDLVMPAMSGMELSDRVRTSRPEIKVLVMSGYADDALLRTRDDARVPFLQKPVSRERLTLKVRELLDGGGGSGA